VDNVERTAVRKTAVAISKLSKVFETHDCDEAERFLLDMRRAVGIWGTMAQSLVDGDPDAALVHAIEIERFGERVAKTERERKSRE
jgi:hypothetical protein